MLVASWTAVLLVLGLGVLEAGMVAARRAFILFPGTRVEASMRMALFRHLQDLRRLTHIGSDHYPIYIRLSYEPHGWHEQERELEAADADDHEEAREKIEEGVEDEEGAGEAGEGGHYSRLVWGGDRFVGGLLFSGEGGGRGGAGDVDMGRGDVKLRLRLKSTGGGGT